MFEKFYDAILATWGKSAKKEHRKEHGKELKKEEYKAETGSGVYGAAAIAQVFKGADFPLSKNDIMQKYGDKEIEYHMGEKQKLKDVLEDIPNESFSSTVEIEQAFHGSLEKEHMGKTRKESETKLGSGIYGAAAIAQVFKGADFPLSKNDIMQKYGDKEIEYHMGEIYKVRDVLEDIPNETYNSTVDLEQAFHETSEKNK